jgi:hypothetical protein
MATTPSTVDANPSMHLHEVLAMEFRVLHGDDLPSSTSEAVPLADEQDADKARQAKRAQEETQQEHLKTIWAAVHGLTEKRAALCISGGGIRSATFALGVLQGLARCGLLGKFHYLSTVSGGGYIGGWLSAWILRAKGGLTEVTENLAGPRGDTRPNPEPTQMQNLRSYSNYLSPRLGLLSADTWTLVATYLRNLLLNWLVLIPLLAAVLTIPWIYVSVLMTNPPPKTPLPFVLGTLSLIVGVAYMAFNLPSSAKGRRGSEKSFLLYCLLPLFLGALLMTILWAWFTQHSHEFPKLPFLPGMAPPAIWLFISFGVFVHLIGWALSLLRAPGFRPLELLAVIASGAAGGTLLWVAAFKFFRYPRVAAELYACFAVPLFLGLFILALVAFAGFSSRWTDDQDREWWARANGWLLILALGWMLISALVIFGPFLFHWAVSAVTTGVIAGVVTVLAGRNSDIPANEKQSGKGRAFAFVLSKASSLAAIIFIAVLAILITLTTTRAVEKIGSVLGVVWELGKSSPLLGKPERYLNIILQTPWWLIAVVTLALVLIGLLMAAVINPNRFSLHAMYRDRLIRAYLGASNRNRNPHPFTGFDENDNPKMRDLWVREKFGRRLMPVVNIALNLVGGKNLAWQERKATSFTVSPLHCGSYAVGYRKTNGAPGYGSEQQGPSDTPTTGTSTTLAGSNYGGDKGISLGTAIAISGAAASPNMGYHSSPLVTFILTLLNVRLGAWLGNPGPAGDKTFHLGFPKVSVRPIIEEAFGLTDDGNPYVYLSDGGHFENLGLYEMVLRRCHYIIVSDAGQDPACSFSDLGGAVRKIRIDLGIPIDFDEPMSIFARSDEKAQNESGRSCAIGKIRYSVVDGPGIDDGVLIYIKPACYGDEPRDIYEYFKSNEDFPHESTGDQFFSESQFESYRMLGAHTMEKICPTPCTDFENFIKGVENYLAQSEADRMENAHAPRN